MAGKRKMCIWCAASTTTLILRGLSYQAAGGHVVRVKLLAITRHRGRVSGRPARHLYL